MDPEAPLWQAIVVIVGIVVTFFLMAFEVAPPDMVMWGLVIIFLPMGIITTNEAISGFASSGLITVAILFIVVEAVSLSGGLELLKKLLIPSADRKRILPIETHLRIIVPVMAISGFINNTPLVILCIPVVQELCRFGKISPSKLMIPLSYASIFGGTISMIGTSTNLVALDIAKQMVPGFNMGFFEIAKMGLPYLLCGFFYLIVFCRFLPSRIRDSDATNFDREYIMGLKVLPNTTVAGVAVGLVGKSIQKAGLRRRGAFLFHIQRGEQQIPAPPPETILEAGDLLLFAGVVDEMSALSSIPGLQLDEEAEYTTLKKLKGEKIMVEAVVGNGKFAGKTIRDAALRTEYGAAVIAVHRQGERVNTKLGDIVLQAGDSLLLVADRKFVSRNRHDPSFALIHQQTQYNKNNRWQQYVSMGLAVAMIAVGAGIDDILIPAYYVTAIFLLIRFISPITARDSIRLDICFVIAASFGISKAMTNSGAAQLIAGGLVQIAEKSGNADLALMIVMYIVTSIFTEFVTNNAAAAVVLPIGIEAALQTGGDVTPIVMAVMLGASASFVTPVGYQCNLLVYGPGGYKYLDYAYFGFPLSIFLVGCVGVLFYFFDVWWVMVIITLVIDIVAIIILLFWDIYHYNHTTDYPVNNTDLTMSEIGVKSDLEIGSGDENQTESQVNGKSDEPKSSEPEPSVEQV